MAGRFVRASNFRHVFADQPKLDKCISNVKLTRSAWDSNFLAANSKYLAICWHSGGGGTFAITDQKFVGKLDSDQPVCTSHSGAVLDLAFHPFNDNIIASSSEDCTAKIWSIPDGGLKENLTESVVTLRGHQKKVGGVYFHPRASNVLATSSPDATVRVWDIETAQEKIQLEGHQDMILSTSWNYDGTLISTTCKDKKIRIFDPRTNTVVAEADAHAGIKGSRHVWLGKSGKMLSVGFTKQSERQVMVWDGVNWDKPIKTEILDTTSGIVMPFYDEDTDLLFLAGKGDGNVRYYEVVADDPKVYYGISEFKSSTPQRGMCMLPKRAADVSNNEVVRLYKLTNTAIEPLKFIVPRKSDMFQEDLFPECVGPDPALTGEAWFAGENAEPTRISLKDGFDPDAHKSTAFAASASAKEANVVTELSPTEMKEKIKQLEANLADRETKIRTLEAKVSELTV